MKQIFTLLCLIPIACYSQIGIAVKTGLNMTYLHFEEAPTLNMEAAPFFGLSAEFRDADIAGELEFNYSSLESGWRDSSTQGLNYRQKASFKNFKTFAMFKYYPVENFNVKFGGYFGVVEDSKYSIEYNGATTETNEKINKNDIGMCLGMEAKVYKGLFLDARIAFDLNNNDDIKSENLLFGAGYRF